MLAYEKLLEPYKMHRLQMYRQEKKKESWRVEMRHWHHSIGLDSLFQKTQMFTPKKRTVRPGDAIENTAF
jgi:hypothetical protein